MTHRTVIAAAVLGSLVLAGCISPQNDRDVIGRDVRLESLSPVETTEAPPTTGLQQSSLTGINRANWSRVTFMLPVDGTAHNPSYSRRVYLADKTARQRRESPTALNALELTGGSESSQQWEAPVNIGWSLLDVVLLVPGMIWQAPWSTRYSPDEAYARYWLPSSTAAPAPVTAPGAPTPVTP